MYQVFNAKKNRWQKFDKNHRLQGTKKAEGPYAKIPKKDEWLKLQEPNLAPDILESVSENDEFEKNSELVTEKTAEKNHEKPQAIDEVAQEVKEEKQPKQPSSKEPKKGKFVVEVIELQSEEKTIDEWLASEKMELLSDNGIMIQHGINSKSKVSKSKFEEILPKLAIRNVM